MKQLYSVCQPQELEAPSVGSLLYADSSNQIYDNGSTITFVSVVVAKRTDEDKPNVLRSHFGNAQLFIMQLRDSSVLQISDRVREGAEVVLFVRNENDSEFTSFGQCQLWGMQAANGVVETIQLRLKVKLPESLWLKFGGTPGWTLIVNRSVTATGTPDDIIPRLRAAWTRTGFEMDITRYEDGSLYVIADASDRAVVRYNTSKGAFRPKDIEVDDETERIQFIRPKGWEIEVPADEVLTLDEARIIAEEFIAAGYVSNWHEC